MHFNRNVDEGGSRLRSLLALGALFALSPFFVRGFQQRPDSSLSEIISQLRAGNDEQALNLLEIQLKTHPKDCRLHSLQGVAFAGLKREDDALRAFDSTLETCPNDLAALEGAGQIRYARKDEGAIPVLERVLALQPANLPAHAMLASALRNRGDCKSALLHFTASRPAFSDRAEWMEGNGACLAITGDYPSALIQYRELSDLHPNDAYLYDIALLESRTGDDRKAFATLEPLLIAGNYAPALSFGAYLAEKLGDTPRAVVLLRRSILLAPDDVQNYLDFAGIALAHQSYQVGIDVLQAGIQRLPQTAPLYLARGVLEVQLSGQTQAAIHDFEEAHRLDPKLSLSVAALGIVATQQHKDAVSREIFEQQAKLSPDDPVLQYLLAEQLSESGADDPAVVASAVAAAKRATVLDPRYLPARNLLAKLYLSADKPKLALEQADLALAEDPNDQEALYQKLTAMRRTGDRAAVQELSQKFDAMRKANAERQKSIDRFRLEEVKQSQ